MNTIFICIVCLTTANAFSLKPIYGGTDAKAGQSPWQTWQLYGGKPFCSGSLIGNHTVLTAAHCCVDDFSDPSKFKVQYGGNDRENFQYSSGVSKLIPHPNYTGNSPDVCVLVLSDQVKLGPDVKLIEIANESPLNGTAANITGWGLSDDSSEDIPRYLQFANVNILNRTECNKLWSVTYIIEQGQICSEKRNMSICGGDSGGALVIDNQVVGVASQGSWCPVDSTKWPDIYADVAFVKTWIREQIELYSNEN